MAPRATWKGFLVLARIGCPVRLYAATVRADRLGLQPFNRATLNRLQMRPHDPQTGKEVAREAVVRGYELEPGQVVPIEERELVGLEITSSRHLLLERFIERRTIDLAYADTPYFLLPDGRGADAAFAVLREAMRRRGLVGVSRLVLGGRERAVLVEPRGRGMMLTTLRAAHEVRGAVPYFGEIDDTPPEETMVQQAERLVARLAGTFDPRRDFRDRYQEALFHFALAKRRGERPEQSRPAAPAVMIDLQEALDSSVAALAEPAASASQTASRLAKQTSPSG